MVYNHHGDFFVNSYNILMIYDHLNLYSLDRYGFTQKKMV